MKTIILASTLLLGFAAASTASTAHATTIDRIDVAELSFDLPEQTQSAPLLHAVKNKRGGGHRGGRDRGGRDNLASDGNIGNGTLRARIQNEERYSARRLSSTRSRNGSSGPFTFFRRIFGN